MNLIYDVAGLLLMGAGITLGLIAQRRRFERTNAFGVERFPTFGAKLRSRFMDYLLKGGAIGSLAVGTLVLSSNHIDTWGWIVMAPVCLYMLYLLIGT